MKKNVASQKLYVFAADYSTGAPKTGDAANLTAYESLDYGTLTVLTDTSATEVSSSNAPGWYVFDLTQAETNADTILFTAKSSTSNVVVLASPAVVQTVAQYFSVEALDSSGRIQVQSGTGTGQISITSGVVSANATQIGGQTASASGTVTFPNATLASTTNITAGTITTVSGNVTGSVGSVVGAVGSVTGAVGSVVGAVGSVTGNVGGNVTGSVGSVVAEVNANITKVNSVTIDGAGTAGDPFGPV